MRVRRLTLLPPSPSVDDSPSAAATITTLTSERNDLLQRVATGDTEAFATLYDDLSPSVFGLIRKVVRDPELSEEVMQEVFVEVWRIAQRFDPERGNASGWVRTIAHRRAVDRVRSEQTRRNHALALGEEPEHLPFDENLASLNRQVLKTALATLSDSQRESIELSYYGGLPQAQIAELLDIPLGTVKTRIRDGLIRLRDVLGERS